jgi:hypothetical protein
MRLVGCVAPKDTQKNTLKDFYLNSEGKGVRLYGTNPGAMKVDLVPREFQQKLFL